MLRAAAAATPCGGSATRLARWPRGAPLRRAGTLWPCRGFVGEQSSTAGEYHDSDFPWESCGEQGLAALGRQRAEHAQLAAEPPAASAPVRPLPSSSGPGGSAQHAVVADVRPDSDRSGGGGARAAGSQEPWEAFHSRHRRGRFFKERRYLPLAFPEILDPGVLHVVELGAGAGASLLPVLRANATCRCGAWLAGRPAPFCPAAAAVLHGAASSSAAAPSSRAPSDT